MVDYIQNLTKNNKTQLESGISIIQNTVFIV